MISVSRMLFEYHSHGIVIEWNGSATYNVFSEGGANINCFSNGSAKTMEEAQVIADEWMNDEIDIDQGE